MATNDSSRKLSKLDEKDMWDTAGEVSTPVDPSHRRAGLDYQ